MKKEFKRNRDEKLKIQLCNQMFEDWWFNKFSFFDRCVYNYDSEKEYFASIFNVIYDYLIYNFNDK